MGSHGYHSRTCAELSQSELSATELSAISQSYQQHKGNSYQPQLSSSYQPAITQLSTRYHPAGSYHVLQWARTATTRAPVLSLTEALESGGKGGSERWRWRWRATATAALAAAEATGSCARDRSTSIASSRASSGRSPEVIPAGEAGIGADERLPELRRVNQAPTGATCVLQRVTCGRQADTTRGKERTCEIAWTARVQG